MACRRQGSHIHWCRPLLAWYVCEQCTSPLTFPNHHLLPAESIKLAHPNAVLVVMTGEEDVITNDDGVDMVFRISYDKGKMGRNPYANFYQYIAQIALLSKLHTMVYYRVLGLVMMRRCVYAVCI